MPLPGVSIIGLLDEARAVAHMQQQYVLADQTPEGWSREWRAARAKIGAPIARAGYPEIQDLPRECQRLADRVRQNPRLKPVVEGRVWALKCVEIAPLLSVQVDVVVAESDRHCSSIAGVPAIRDMVPVCLPPRTETVQPELVNTESGVALVAPNLNLALMGGGIFRAAHADHSMQLAGIHFGGRAPFVIVMRHGGRCYLFNGYHRAYGFGIAGATHLPCILLDAVAPDEIAMLEGMADLHNGENPPTCGHFTQGRAHSVQIRRMRQVVEFSWKEYRLLVD